MSDHEEELDEDEEAEPSFPAAPLSPWDIPIRLVVMLEKIFGAIAEFFDCLTMDFIKHYNFRLGQKHFAESVRSELEKLPTTTKE